jgi:hypothetical protein
MPSKVRIIAGPRNTSFDSYIRDLIAQDGYGKERTYFGITDQDRADKVRRAMRQAGKHLNLSVKAFWQPCSGCRNGGRDCRFHVLYSAYDPGEAKRYKEQQAAITRRKR